MQRSTPYTTREQALSIQRGGRETAAVVEASVPDASGFLQRRRDGGLYTSHAETENKVTADERESPAP
jgi:hypothetical protein